MTLQGIPIFYVPERLWYRLTVKMLGVGVLAVSDSEVSFRSRRFLKPTFLTSPEVRRVIENAAFKDAELEARLAKHGFNRVLSSTSIGNVDRVTIHKRLHGYEVKARLFDGSVLKPIDDAWGPLKPALLSGVAIGLPSREALLKAKSILESVGIKVESAYLD